MANDAYLILENQAALDASGVANSDQPTPRLRLRLVLGDDAGNLLALLAGAPTGTEFAVPVRTVVAGGGPATVIADQGTVPWICEDHFSSMESLSDAAGANAVQTFTFANGPVDLIWVESIGGIARADATRTPSATKGAYCADGVPTPINVTTTSIKIYIPTGATVSVWGMRY